MRCQHWMLLAALAVAALAGCEGSTDSGEAPSSSGAAPQSEQAGVPTAQAGVPTAQAGVPMAQQPAAGRQVPTPPPDTSTPAKATTVFLDALRRGDDEMILQMYSQRARQQANEHRQHFTPKGSDTAQFRVGQVESMGNGVSHVACAWTDLDQDGNLHTLEFVWALRQEPLGWRVAGMVITPFPGEPPVLLDFENLPETIGKIDQLTEEIHRRNAPAGEIQQAKNSEAAGLR